MPVHATMPVGDITETKVIWKMQVHEHFDSPVALGTWPGQYAAKWFTYPSSWRDTDKRGVYTPGIISVHDSCLDYWLHVDAAGVPQVAAISPILPGGAAQKGQLYQRHAYRFKIDPVPGFKAAWLLWPDSQNWPIDGEIDFPEADFDKPIQAFVHHQGGTSASDQADYSTTVPLGGAWHNAEVIWSPGGVECKLDGVVIGNCTTRIPNTPMHLVLQCEDSLDGEVPAQGAVAHVLCDWIAIWSWTGA